MSEYNDDLKIDFNNLEENLRDQPKNYFKWAEKWVNAVAERDRKKEEVEIIKARLDSKYRKILANGNKRPTEATILAAIQSDPEYQKAQSELIDLTENMNILASAKIAFEHRKKALEGLINLWINGYWSDHAKIVKEKEKTNVLNSNKRLQKRKIKK